MATNGDAQRLEQVERAITGGERQLDPVDYRRDPMVTRPGRGETAVPAAVADAASDDVVARVDAAAELCREVGRYASDHGRYLDEISAAFAERLQAMTKEYAANMLAAEERKMAELRRIREDRGMTAAEFLLGAALFGLAYRFIAGHWPWQ